MNGNADGTSFRSSKREILASVARQHLSILVDPAQQADRERRMEPLLKALTANVFRLVVMGEIKKGKSSFINALLGQKKLLPTDIDIATSTVFKIVYGPVERVTVFYVSDGDHDESNRKPEEIDRDDLWIYGTERGVEELLRKIAEGRENLNSGSTVAEVCQELEISEETWYRWLKKFGSMSLEEAKRSMTLNIDFIAIELPNALLADGIVIVDTPGVGGLFKRHRDVTFRYAPQADVVFFVLDSAEAVIGEDEQKFLRELQKNTQHIVFLQTKIDIAGIEQIQSWRKRNLQILSELLKVSVDEIPYFLVGAKLKELADKRNDIELLRKSGYLDVQEYVKNRLIPQRDEILARKWLPVLGPELVNSAKQVQDRLAIVKSAHLPQIAEYEKQLTDAEKEFDRWQNDVFPGQMRLFQDEVGRIKRDTRNRLQDHLSADSRECVESIEMFRQSCKDVDDVNSLGEDFLGAWATTWNEAAITLLSRFQKDYLAQCSELFGHMSSDLQVIRVPNIELEPALLREYQVDQTTIIRDTYMNYSVFNQIAGGTSKAIGTGAAIAVVAGILAAPIGLAVAAAAGVGFVATKIWSTVRGYSMSKERQRDAATRNVEQALSRTSNTAIRSSLRVFEDIAAELDSKAKLQTDSFRASFRNDFSTRRQELLQSKSRSIADAKSAEDNLKGMFAKYQELLKTFQFLQKELDAGGSKK